MTALHTTVPSSTNTEAGVTHNSWRCGVSDSDSTSVPTQIYLSIAKSSTWCQSHYCIAAKLWTLYCILERKTLGEDHRPA